MILSLSLRLDRLGIGSQALRGESPRLFRVESREESASASFRGCEVGRGHSGGLPHGGGGLMVLWRRRGVVLVALAKSACSPSITCTSGSG